VPPEPTYAVYFNPNEKGKEAFNWERRKLAGGMSKEDAGEFAYLERRDEQAPDFHIYGSIDVEPEPVDDGRNMRAKRNKAALVAACRQIMQDGWFRPTTQAIASRAGLSIRTVFVHFKNAEALYLEATKDETTCDLIMRHITGPGYGPHGAEFTDRIVRAVILGKTAE
jgi:hypothetical protein